MNAYAITWNGDTTEAEGFTLTRREEADTNYGTPWEEEDGHGPVSDWTSSAKRPGELVLAESHGRRRYYDFQEACRIARKDQWGARPYREDLEKGANGLVRFSAHWFKGRELVAVQTDWHDDRNRAAMELYRLGREALGAREFAAQAARQDFEHLRRWSEGDWRYVGVIVTAERQGVELARASLWGVSDEEPAYLDEVSGELAHNAIDEAKAKLESLCACHEETAA